MSKHDAVDQLMRMATQEVAPARDGAAAEKREAEAVLQEKVMETEPGMQPSTPESQAPVSPSERGRALFQAMRPLLPVVGGALRRVPHPAGKVAADLLPWLGNMGAMVADRVGSRAMPTPVQPESPSLAADPRTAQLVVQLKECRGRLDGQEDQLRRMREILERTTAEQGTLTHQALRLADRVRLLTAGVVILLMLVVAQMVLLAITWHH